MKRRTSTAAASFLIALSLLAGCGDNTDLDRNENQDGTNEECDDSLAGCASGSATN